MNRKVWTALAAGLFTLGAGTQTWAHHSFAAVYDIACLPEGGRPEKYDFAKLTARLAERLPR